MTLPRRIKKQSVRQSDRVRCPGHLQWVRGFKCSVWRPGAFPLQECIGSSEAAHVRSSGDGGVGLKPGDEWAVSLCSHHHREQHQIGEQAFERKYAIDMKKLAAEFAAKSDPLRRYLARKRAA